MSKLGPWPSDWPTMEEVLDEYTRLKADPKPLTYKACLEAIAALEERAKRVKTAREN